MKKIIIAAAVATLGIASYTLPAFADAEDYGQYVYTDQSPSRFAPGGQAIDSRDFQANIEFGTVAPSAPAANRADLFERLDRAHEAW